MLQPPDRAAAYIGPCIDAHRRLMALTADIDDGAVGAPTRLRGWTVGHLLTHLARNADSHCRVLEAAGRGEVVLRYPGGSAQRTQEIEAGATRPAAEVLADLGVTIERLEGAWASAPARAWAGRCRNGAGVTEPVADLPFLRLREAECHAIDLDRGATVADWAEIYVMEELRRAEAVLGPFPPSALTLHAPDRAAWVMGRANPPGLDAVRQWF